MQTIPITLQPVPVPVGISYATINDLLTIVAKYLSAQIESNVTFIQEFATNPSTFQGDLIFNTTTGLWMRWDIGTASYVPLTAFAFGDTKNTFVSGDDVTGGWIVCDGRKISAIQGISQNQAAILQTLFGVDGSLPTLTPLQSLSGLPTNGAFSNITNPAVQPPLGQIGALTFSSPPTQTEVQALAQNTEVLDGSAISTQGAVAAVIVQAEALLQALNQSATTAKLYSKIYVGPS